MLRSRPLSTLSICLIIIAVIALVLGPVDISLWHFLKGEQSELENLILMDIRLPRIALNIIVGAGIAVAGAAIQGLFRNPLADPALIGVSSGAALFAAGFMVIGFNEGIIGRLGLSGCAFVGGLLTTFIVLAVGRRSGSVSGMLLAGIAINAIALSGIGLFSYLSTDAQLRSVAFWALGSFGSVEWEMVGVALIILPFIALLFRESPKLNAITLGDQEAASLGIFVPLLRRRVIIYTALIVSISVSLVGVISFVGLIVPHLIRLSCSSSHQVLIPCSALLGAILVVVADGISRTVFAPAEMPVGIFLAMVGGPFFIYLILRSREKLGI
ncbi:MAG: iron complex transport system permease protein [Candidatus Azotimanducaceae bacterium]